MRRRPPFIQRPPDFSAQDFFATISDLAKNKEEARGNFVPRVFVAPVEAAQVVGERERAGGREGGQAERERGKKYLHDKQIWYR